MFGKKPIASRRPCLQCGGTVYYVAGFLSRFTGFRKRVCRTCGYVESGRVKIVSDSAQSF